MSKSKIEYIKNTFSKKIKVELYIPLLENKGIYDNYIVELLDLLDVYICPVQNNIHKNDILEYFICPSYFKMGLFNFLRFKRYIATEEDFKDLFVKYSKKDKIDKNIIEGYKIFINVNLFNNKKVIEDYIKDIIDKINKREDIIDKNISRIKYSLAINDFILKS